MSSVPNPEPTIADVLAELRVMRLEQRTDTAELRYDMISRLGDLRSAVNTIIDELAAFRAEYNQHTHGTDE